MNNQYTIIKRKLWLAFRDKVESVFPLEFYSELEVFECLSHTFDRNHVTVTTRFGKTDKGYDAIFVNAKSK